jgi:poly(3-hydroxybutyrate) depolymerase
MAVVMAATYPDIYAAAGILAGCPFMACTDVTGSGAFAAMGDHARAMPMLVATGTLDHLLGVAPNRAIVNEWLGVADLADDGAMNLSVSRAPASTDDSHGLDPSDLDSAGTMTDICDRPLRASFCYGGALGWDDYPYTVEHYANGDGGSLIDFWLIHGLGHAYPAGPADTDFTDTHGPWISAAMYDFFVAHPMPG